MRTFRTENHQQATERCQLKMLNFTKIFAKWLKVSQNIIEWILNISSRFFSVQVQRRGKLATSLG